MSRLPRLMHRTFSPRVLKLDGGFAGLFQLDFASRLFAPGDTVLGIASSGLHSNGYSLVRKVVFDLAGLGVHDQVPDLGQTVGEALLTPTRIYARPIRKILQHYKVKNVVHGIAHITGGGLRDNLERILPENIQAV